MNIVELQEHIAKVMERTRDPGALEIILQLSRMVKIRKVVCRISLDWLYEAGKPFLHFEREATRKR